jgi:hypothetical protein
MSDDLFVDDPNELPDETLDDKNYYEELVGDGKKFRDPEALARSKAEADAFITRLQRENAGLRDDLQARVKMEEFLDRVSKSAPPASPEPTDDSPEPESTAKTGDLNKLIEDTLTAREKQAARRSNLDEVKKTLREQFGPNYASKFREIARELGVGEKFLEDTAASSPKAFYKLTGVAEKRQVEQFEAPPKSTFIPQAQGTTGKNYAAYERLRKEKPSEYWSPRVQNEMYREAERQGDAFYK